MVADPKGQALADTTDASQAPTAEHCPVPAFELLWSGNLPRIVPAPTPREALHLAWDELRDRLSQRNGFNGEDTARMEELRRIIHSRGHWRSSDFRAATTFDGAREDTAA
ncbi:MAG: hypothetical protein ACR2PA_17920 [Hyphomicrobiaceae bacterium]